MATQKGIGGLQGGWGGSILSVLFTIFVVSIIFGILLIAITTTNTALARAGTVSYVYTFTNSVNAVNDLAANAIVLTSTNTFGQFPSISQPLTISITGNIITTYGTNAVQVASTTSQTQVFTADSATNTITTTGNFFNITQVTFSGIPVTQTGNFVATLTQTFGAAVYKSAPWTNTVNSIVATASVTVLNQSTMSIGNSGTSTLQVFTTLVGYIVTLANFVGIIILLAIIVVVVAVLYIFFRPKGEGAM